MQIQHKPTHQWVASDYDDANRNTDPLDLIDLSDLDWSGLKTRFREYWDDDANLERWVETSRSLARIRNHGMTNALYKMSRDLICCGVVTGVWSSTAEAIRHMAQYWQWHQGNIESQATATQKALAAFIEDRTASTVAANKAFSEKGMAQFITPLEIDAKELKNHVDGLRASGELDTNSNTRDITEAMANLGWCLKPNKKRQNSWQPING